MRHTETDFDHLSWHDCHLWGLELRAGDPDAGDWTSDLALDIDFIVEWMCAPGGGGRFRVAPASLVFHGVTDPRISIDWGAPGHQTLLHPASIDRIERQPVPDRKVFLDRDYFAWRISLNWPAGGEISFGAAGFTQTLRAAPVVTDAQHLSFESRRRMLAR